MTPIAREVSLRWDNICIWHILLVMMRTKDAISAIQSTRYLETYFRHTQDDLGCENKCQTTELVGEPRSDLGPFYD